MGKPNAKNLPPHLRKDDGGYFIDYFVEELGVKKRKRVRLGHVPLVQAKSVLSDHMQAIVKGKFLLEQKPKITFNEAADNFLAFSRARRKRFGDDERMVKNLKSFFDKRPLESLTLDQVEEYVSFRRNEARKDKEICGVLRKGIELKAASLNRELACLRTVVRRAILNRQIDRNPIEGLKLFKETFRDRTLTPEEYQRLLAACAPHLKIIVQLAYDSAMRKGEILGLKWEQINFREGVIILDAADTKTQEKREIPLDEKLVSLLQGLPKVPGCPFVFTYQKRGLVTIMTAFKAACRRANIKDLHFHDLRHCSITNFRKAGVSDNTTMSISGHKTHDVFKRYDRIDRGDRQKALEQVRKMNDTDMTRTTFGAPLSKEEVVKSLSCN